MGSRDPRVDLYDPKIPDALGQAFDATWLVLQPRDAFRDFERDLDLKSTLSLTLMALAADRVTDPVELERGLLRASR